MPLPFKLSDLYRTKEGAFDPAKAATSAGMAALAYGALNKNSGLGKFLGMGSNQRPVGYSEGIPEYTVARQLAPNAFATTAPSTTVGPGMMEPRRPGSGGRRYFTDMTYTPTGKTMGPKPSGGVYDSLTSEEAEYFLTNMFNGRGVSNTGGTVSTTTTTTKPKYTTAQVNDTLGTLVNQYTTVDPATNKKSVNNQGLYRDVGQRIKTAVGAGEITLEDAAKQIADSNFRVDGKSLTPQEIIDAYKGMGFAQGGLASLPQSQGYYLGGATDGMADEIPASINGEQAAALSDGEFVVPADVVSGLGNGNSDAGAKVLYSMLDRVRQARTGTTEQGRKIAPNKFTPV
jgi:hypothetical protein